MIKHKCCMCKKPVNITDLVVRELDIRSEWRSPSKRLTNNNFEQMLKEHPIIEACHKECDKKCDPPTKWFRFKRCSVPGCCVPK